MFLFGLHALGWDGPQLCIQINLRPATADDFTRATGIQDSELQGPRGDALACCELNQKVGYISKGQCRVMLDLGNCAAGGQGMDQVTVPGSWIFSRPIAACLREIENGLNSAPHPARSLGLGVPD